MASAEYSSKDRALMLPMYSSMAAFIRTFAVRDYVPTAEANSVCSISARTVERRRNTKI